MDARQKVTRVLAAASTAVCAAAYAAVIVGRNPYANVLMIAVALGAAIVAAWMTEEARAADAGAARASRR